MTPDLILESIRTRTARAGVIGLGYVGLPLLIEFAKAGFDVLGFDVDQARVDAIGRGESYLEDVTVDDLRKVIAGGRLRTTTGFDELSNLDTVNICVPTPLRKTKDPDLSFVVAAVDEIARHLRPGQLIILESTTYPGTVEEVVKPKLEATGLLAGQDFFLAFSPERVDPGNVEWPTSRIPKVVGGIDEDSTRVATALYEQIIEKVVPVSSARVAEMVKLLENTFRAVNIALVNEVALIADRLDVDVWEVIEAASTKPFGFMKFTPGPGLGGHCIPVDPHYLAWKMRTLNYRTRFIELASEINAEMPEFVVGKVRAALNARQKAVSGARILVLGVAYKRDVDDVRESPALDIIGLLTADGAHVEYHDPFVPELAEDGAHMSSVALTDQALAEADAVVIVTDHTDIDYARVLEQAAVLVDARHVVAALLEGSGSQVDRRGSRTGAWIVKGGP